MCGKWPAILTGHAQNATKDNPEEPPKTPKAGTRKPVDMDIAHKPINYPH